MRVEQLPSGHTLVVGDCVSGMRELLEDCEIDAVVTDPPYGLEFMNKGWDKLDDNPQWAKRRGRGCSKVGDDRTKPASRSRVSYGGKRSQFRRCTICGRREFSGSPCGCEAPTWVVEYPEGAPSGMLRQQAWHERWTREAHRVVKPGAHLVSFGGQRTIHRLTCALEDAGWDIRDQLGWLQYQGFPKSMDLEKAVRKEARKRLGPVAAEILARQYRGRGTALKPAIEPAVLARRPVEGTIAANVLAWGVGGLEIDACRYPYGSKAWPGPNSEEQARRKHASNAGCSSDRNRACYSEMNSKRDGLGFRSEGRFPANVYHCPKASTSERERGCEGLRQASAGELTGGRKEGSDGLKSPRAGAGRTSSRPIQHDEIWGLTQAGQLWHADPRWVNEVQSQALRAATAGSQNPDIVGFTTAPNVDSASSMCSCGSRCTDLSRPGFKSIIETAISSTTESRIWKRSRQPHTSGCIAAASFVMASGGNLVVSAASTSQSTKITGISPGRDIRSTVDASRVTSAKSLKQSAAAKQARELIRGFRAEGRGNLHPT